MTQRHRTTDDAIRAALRSNLPSRPPVELGDAIWRSIAMTPQESARRSLVGGRFATLPRPVLLLGAVAALLLLFALAFAIGSRLFVPRAPLDVSTYHGGPDRSGVMPGPGPLGKARIEWQVNLPGPIRGQPAVVAGLVFVADGSGNVEARSEATGDHVWAATVGAAVIDSVGVSDGRVFVGDESGAITAFDAASGLQLWARASGGAIRASPVVAGGLLIVGSMGATVAALDPATGEVRWSVPVPGAVSRSLAIADGLAYVPTDGGTLVVLDAATGAERWRLAFGPGNLGTVAVVNGVLYVTTGVDVLTASHALIAIDAQSHAVLWSHNEPTNSTLFVGGVTADTVVVASLEDNHLYALDRATGVDRWSFQTKGQNGNLAGIASGTVYLPSADHSVYAVDLGTGREVWSLSLKGVPAALAVIDDRVIVGTDLGVLVSITDGPAPTGGPASP
jgi:outer membrane protein assembly factor BamB